MAQRAFATFDDFYPYYVAMHSRPATRWFHFAGTLTGAVLGVTGIARRRWRRLLLAPMVGYGAAWGSHWGIERNNPASFGYPLWSVYGDLKMIRTMLSGRDAELTAIARQWLADHPDDRSAGSLAPDAAPAAASAQAA